MEEGRARLVRRWTLGLIGVSWTLASLALAGIPFAAFAFAGGAIAIGVGFGTQNLFKNLISGMVVLIERPFRLGDVVEVGALRGTVIDIDLRASVIRDSAGAETLIPNSSLVENSVKNLTFRSRDARQSLHVCVEAGSDPRAVIEAMRGAAQRHGQLMHDPPAAVHLEELGLHGLRFVMHYWIELRPGIDRHRIGSDLRLMVLSAFAENGIRMSQAISESTLRVEPLRVPETSGLSTQGNDRSRHLGSTSPITRQYVGRPFGQSTPTDADGRARTGQAMASRGRARRRRFGQPRNQDQSTAGVHMFANPFHPTRSRTRTFGSVLFSMLCIAGSLAPPTAEAQSGRAESVDTRPFPRQFEQGSLRFWLHSPQFESLSGNQIRGRAAVSVQIGERKSAQGHAEAQLTYGVLWFSARVEIDKMHRIATLSNIRIDRASFPTRAGEEGAYLAAIQKTAANVRKAVSLDQLEASIALGQVQSTERSMPVSNIAPEIIFAFEPSLLYAWTVSRSCVRCTLPVSNA